MNFKTSFFFTEISDSFLNFFLRVFVQYFLFQEKFIVQKLVLLLLSYTLILIALLCLPCKIQRSFVSSFSSLFSSLAFGGFAFCSLSLSLSLLHHCCPPQSLKNLTHVLSALLFPPSQWWFLLRVFLFFSLCCCFFFKKTNMFWLGRGNKG